MSSSFEKFEGSFDWTRVHTPEKSPFTKPGEPEKFNWKTKFRPKDQENLMKLMDLQAKGVKNKLGKDDTGYFMNFNRPTEIKSRGGVVKLDPPKVYQADGVTPLEDFIGNGSKGFLTLEVEEYTNKAGKGCTARLDSICVTDLVKYEGSNSNSAF